MTGAAPAGSEIIEEALRRLPSVKQISQGYGMTEQSMCSHMPVFGMDNPAAAGRLIANLEMKVVDVETKETLPLGGIGELYSRGPTVMRGYYNRPKETAEAVDEDGWLRTGDIGYQGEDGWTYVVDRLKELIKVKGFQVCSRRIRRRLRAKAVVSSGGASRVRGLAALASGCKGRCGDRSGGHHVGGGAKGVYCEEECVTHRK